MHHNEQSEYGFFSSIQTSELLTYMEFFWLSGDDGLIQSIGIEKTHDNYSQAALVSLLSEINKRRYFQVIKIVKML